MVNAELPGDGMVTKAFPCRLTKESRRARRQRSRLRPCNRLRHRRGDLRCLLLLVFCVSLMGGVNKEVGFFDDFVRCVFGEAHVRAFGSSEQIVGKLAVMVGVPEDFGLYETSAEF